MTTLSARGVSMRLGGAQVLTAVDLAIEGGEVVALVGPNGAGKSTLLGALSGDLEPDAGEVTLDGRPLGARTARELARARAVLLQRQGLAFGFRVEEVVRMGRAPWYRTPAADDDDRLVTESMARADVTPLALRLYPTLSGGEQARVSFARTLAQAAPVLLLDEPTAALDIRHQEAVLAVARESAVRGVAVVVVLHDLALAAAYADRVCVLSAGTVAADGPPTRVLTDELLTRVYEHPVRVIEVEGSLVVLPVRSPIALGAEESTCAPS
ncbi:heme ABC transporter ATP-binding protein [uncultured Nocardioides sp.]|uniref:heme ABC transporter ATP-binding protein n=1 Tax=uncultured Nocardioides sp. TaxID=198441 RepID=UPI00260FE0F6|nr:heme ABC transporter ATP-binding protein [uncultured Nocardioides sp.]